MLRCITFAKIVVRLNLIYSDFRLDYTSQVYIRFTINLKTLAFKFMVIIVGFYLKLSDNR